MSGSHPPAIPAAAYAERLVAARRALRERGAGALLVGPGPDLRWLAGYDAMALERLTLLVVPGDEEPAILVPRLEIARARLAPALEAGLVRLVPWDETDDPIGLVPGLLGRAGAAPGHGPGAGRGGRLLVSDRLWAAFVLPLQATLSGARFGLASEALRDLRAVKDADEIALLRAAAHAADRVVAGVAHGPLVGRTEIDVAREVRERLVAEGHQSAGFAIVGSGPNSASPHHAPSDRRITEGEPIVLDIGGTIGGYGSDITRTLWIGGAGTAAGPTAEYLDLYGALQAAQAEATAAVGPGIACERIDAIARDAITAAGYGRFFVHRTGHGIGLEEHEAPYIVAGNTEALRPGHAFSVEPGIYIDGRFGARIEDIVVCGSGGPDVLNEAPRDLLIVDGR
jgi:Xaa-Pro aminopeptidase